MRRYLDQKHDGPHKACMEQSAKDYKERKIRRAEKLEENQAYKKWLESQREFWRERYIKKCSTVVIDGETYFRSVNGKLYIKAKDGGSFRFRRGKLVEIPREWVGRTVTPQTISRRPSKQGNGRRFRRKKNRKRKK